MRAFYVSLSEKHWRRYAAVEAAKIGYGGTEYIATLFDCHPNTIRQGREDVDELPPDAADGRVRKNEADGKSALIARPIWQRTSAKWSRITRRATPSGKMWCGLI